MAASAACSAAVASASRSIALSAALTACASKSIALSAALTASSESTTASSALSSSTDAASALSTSFSTSGVRTIATVDETALPRRAEGGRCSTPEREEGRDAPAAPVAAAPVAAALVPAALVAAALVAAALAAGAAALASGRLALTSTSAPGSGARACGGGSTPAPVSAFCVSSSCCDRSLRAGGGGRTTAPWARKTRCMRMCAGMRAAPREIILWDWRKRNSLTSASRVRSLTAFCVCSPSCVFVVMDRLPSAPAAYRTTFWLSWVSNSSRRRLVPRVTSRSAHTISFDRFCRQPQAKSSVEASSDCREPMIALSDFGSKSMRFVKMDSLSTALEARLPKTSSACCRISASCSVASMPHRRCSPRPWCCRKCWPR